MNKRYFLSILLTSVSQLVMADGLIDQVYPPRTSSSNQVAQDGLERSYSVDREFRDISQLTQTLVKLGIPTQIANYQESEPRNLRISSNSNLRNFVNKAASGFGYSWSYESNQIVFKAKNPIIRPQLVAQAPLWEYSPNDKYISVTLGRWSQQAGYQLVWQAAEDFEVHSSGGLRGSFKDVVNEVLKSFKYSEQPLQANWYTNRVVVITGLGSRL